VVNATEEATMKILVTAASKHGATAEIATAIAEELEGQGHHPHLAAPERVTSLDGYGAVVLGSAVYAGRWREEARDLVDRLGAELEERPVWLFSSGPLGQPPKPDEDPVDAEAMVSATGAHAHRVFAGRLDRDLLGFAEKAIVVALRAPEGDFRDWDEIRGWAVEIASALTTGPPEATESSAAT
jgi:menaquinone-dependent protoporphyrinogen oxidase